MLNINKNKTRTEANTTNKVVPPMGMTKGRMTRHHGYPARPARQTKATPALLGDAKNKTNIK